MSSDTSCRTALLNYGFYISLLEAILKVEIYPLKNRSTAFELLIKVLKALDPSNPLLHRITQLFPLHIQQVI